MNTVDLDAPDARCLVPYDHLATPSPNALTITLAAPATVAAGAEASFTLELRNGTSAPIDVPVPDGCLAWDATATNGMMSTLESECGGLCGSPPRMLRVTLVPGGILRKRIVLRATRTRISGEGCEEQSLGALPPGSYTMTVILPWTVPRPTPGNAEARDNTTFEAPLVVTP